MAARPIHRAVSRLGRTRRQRRQEVQASVTWPVRLHLWKHSQSLEPSLPGSVGLLFPVELSLWHKTEPLTLASVKGMCHSPHPHFIRDVPRNHVGPISKYSQFGFYLWRVSSSSGEWALGSPDYTVSLLTAHSSPSVHTQGSLWPPEALMWDINISYLIVRLQEHLEQAVIYAFIKHCMYKTKPQLENSLSPLIHGWGYRIDLGRDIDFVSLYRHSEQSWAHSLVPWLPLGVGCLGERKWNRLSYNKH